MGIIYVTEDAKTGVDSCTSLKKRTFAIAVPKTARIVIYITAFGKAGLLYVSSVKKLLKIKIINAGIIINA